MHMIMGTETAKLPATQWPAQFAQIPRFIVDMHTHTIYNIRIHMYSIFIHHYWRII
jgi:hypothetical protein